METFSLEELTKTDERTLLFTPMGLGLDRRLTPESACEFQQAVIADTDLAADVPESVRNAFERLRRCHVYGVLCYDNYTIAADHTSVVLELALRERFIGFYGGRIPLENKAGELDLVEVASMYDLGPHLRRGGSHARGWRLRPKSPGSTMDVPKTLAPLLRWAGLEGLLPGQRNRIRGPLLAELRNDFAHGAGFRVAGPVESAQRIRDLAEMINQLWGSPTPGGRLYPGPLRREVRFIAWSDRARTHCRPDQLPRQIEEDGSGYSYIAVRCVPDDPRLWDFDARYERTFYPCDLLWGPDGAEAALKWCQTAPCEPDEVQHLDRPFVVRADGGRTSLAMRPEVFAGLPPEGRKGQWHLLRADLPIDAFVHVRSHAADDSEGEPACGCAVYVICVGSWEDVRAELGNVGLPVDPPSVRVPGFMSDAPDVLSDQL